MPISYSSTTVKLHSLLRRMRNERLAIPDHQRDFVWSLRQQCKLVLAIRRGKPIPSILLRELDDDTQTLEDGQQRLKTMLRYVDNEFSVEGHYFRDLSPEEQERIKEYNVIATTYSGADDELAREIFNDFQNGRPLTVGERLYSLYHTSPIVRYTVERLLTPGHYFHERMAPMFAMSTRTAKARRGSDMVTAFCLCAGLAFRIDYLSRKWDDIDNVLHRTIDTAEIDAKLDTYVRVWERVHQMAPVTTKTRRNEYWNLGNFGGYIAYSLEMHATAAGQTEFNLPSTVEGLVDAWATHIAEVYADEALLYRVLHRDLSAARSWKKARWANGLRRLFTVDPTVLTDSDDDDDE